VDEFSVIKTYNEGIEAVITLVKGMNNHITELTQQISNLKIDMSALSESNQKLNGRITELEARLNKNSGNSNKPPSSDGLKKPRNMREKSGKPTGGQPGHEGRTLNKVENPDEIVGVEPDKCECGCDLSDVKASCQTRQVVEIPEIKTKVTEYRMFKKECPACKRVHKTEFPENVTQPIQYGENMQALMAYLTNYQLLPLERAAEILSDIIGQKVSEGTLVNVNNRLHEKLEEAEASIKQQLIESPVVHFDETGVRCSGKTQWLHSASTEQLTHYEVHEKRGAKAANDIGFRSTSATDALNLDLSLCTMLFTICLFSFNENTSLIYKTTRQTPITIFITCYSSIVSVYTIIYYSILYALCFTNPLPVFNKPPEKTVMFAYDMQPR